METRKRNSSIAFASWDVDGSHPLRHNFTLNPEGGDREVLKKADSSVQPASVQPGTVLPISSDLNVFEVLAYGQGGTARSHKQKRRSQVLDESLWVACQLSVGSEALHCDGRCVSSGSRITGVTVPVTLGAFVFQVHTKAADEKEQLCENGCDEVTYTFRASSLSQLSDCCEGLWRLQQRSSRSLGSDSPSRAGCTSPVRAKYVHKQFAFE